LVQTRSNENGFALNKFDRCCGIKECIVRGHLCNYQSSRPQNALAQRRGLLLRRPAPSAHHAVRNSAGHPARSSAFDSLVSNIRRSLGNLRAKLPRPNTGSQLCGRAGKQPLTVLGSSVGAIRPHFSSKRLSTPACPSRAGARPTITRWKQSSSASCRSQQESQRRGRQTR